MVDKKLSKIDLFKDNGSVAGFTLIELLAAIAVFFIGILAAFSLSLNNLNTVKENYNRVVAADLAREGIEIVRNIRDSNWLAREANVDSDTSDPDIDLYEWDSGLSSDYFAVDYSGNITSPISASDLSTAINDNDSARLYLDGDFYSSVSVSGQATGFRRVVNLKAICLNTDPAATPPIETVSSNLTCSGSEKIGLQVTSRVQYTYGSKTNHIDAVENIYNWRQ
jgi:prepilin-type N-terminal cleavage/methylation domain-containing protein